jgi:dTDP-4-dehydrorhamnose reductase
MRLLLFGGWGQLGSDLELASRGRHELNRPTRAEVDVTDSEAVGRAIQEARPDAVVNAAAFHKVVACEEHPDRAFAVNATAAYNVAKAAASAGSRCLFVSTDYVFDGSDPRGYGEDSPTAPLSVYGVSKAAGERLVRVAAPDSLVVRGSGMFGHAGSSGKGGNFVETILAKAVAGEAIAVVDNQVFSPTSTHDLAERILMLLEARIPAGIYHGANSGSCSWYGFARRILELAGLHADLSPRAASPDGVKRPECSILLDSKSDMLGLPRQRSWEEALHWYLEHRAA